MSLPLSHRIEVLPGATSNGRTGEESPCVVSQGEVAPVAGPLGETVMRLGGELQDDFNAVRAIETLLTDVVLRLRRTWCAGPAECWSSVAGIREIAVEDLNKRVAATVYEGFVQFSDFLCGLEILLTQHKQGSADFLEALGKLEEFVIHSPLYVLRQNLISARQKGFKKIAQAVRAGDGSTDSGKVHESSPSVEEGDVGVSDSTLRGDAGGNT